MVSMAYFRVSEDSITAAEQKGHIFKKQNKRDTFSNLQLNLCTSQFCWNKKTRSLDIPLNLPTYERMTAVGMFCIHGAVDTLSIPGFLDQFPQVFAFHCNLQCQ